MPDCLSLSKSLIVTLRVCGSLPSSCKRRDSRLTNHCILSLTSSLVVSGRNLSSSPIDAGLSRLIFTTLSSIPLQRSWNYHAQKWQKDCLFIDRPWLSWLGRSCHLTSAWYPHRTCSWRPQQRAQSQGRRRKACRWMSRCLVWGGCFSVTQPSPSRRRLETPRSVGLVCSGIQQVWMSVCLYL